MFYRWNTRGCKIHFLARRQNCHRTATVVVKNMRNEPILFITFRRPVRPIRNVRERDLLWAAHGFRQGRFLTAQGNCHPRLDRGSRKPFVYANQLRFLDSRVRGNDASGYSVDARSFPSEHRMSKPAHSAFGGIRGNFDLVSFSYTPILHPQLLVDERPFVNRLLDHDPAGSALTMAGLSLCAQQDGILGTGRRL